MMNDGRAALRDPPRRAAARGPRRPRRTSSPSTTSPSSSCATSGASTAGGGTATPRRSSPPPDAALATELAALAGGPAALVRARARAPRRGRRRRAAPRRATSPSSRGSPHPGTPRSAEVRRLRLHRARRGRHVDDGQGRLPLGGPRVARRGVLDRTPASPHHRHRPTTGRRDRLTTVGACPLTPRRTAVFAPSATGPSAPRRARARGLAPAALGLHALELRGAPLGHQDGPRDLPPLAGLHDRRDRRRRHHARAHRLRGDPLPSVRPDDERVPRQTQYHLPMEVVYTIIPILIVLVLFAFTVVVENDVTALPTPAATIKVDAFQWGWRFTYPGFTVVGQTTQRPTMEMPEQRAGPHRACSPWTSCTASSSRTSTSSARPCPGWSTSSPSTPPRRARSSASARSSAGSTTRSCGSRSRWSPSRSTRRGSSRTRPRPLGWPRVAASSGDRPAAQPEHRGAALPGRGDELVTELIERQAAGGEAVVVDAGHDAGHDAHEHHEATGILKWLTSTDHKVIGLSYTITSLIMFVIAGVAGRDDPHPARPRRTTRSSRSPSSTSCSRCTAA